MAAMTVLIVEDDPLVALDLAEIVESRGDAQVQMTASAREAARHAEVDVALLDVDVVDGKTYGLARQLKTRNVPFVFVSGSMPRDMPEELRAVPFISKPFDRRTIEEVVDTRGFAREMA